MKFNIRKKLVSLAVASAVSGGAMMMAAPAHAMNVSQNNVGQVLLFPYYTVKNGFDTLFSVTNTTNRTAVFKIRWREALNSREVRDFNVILSPFDVWNGVVTAGADGGAVFRTWDKSCTSPRLPGMVAKADRDAVNSKGEIPFTNGLLTDSAGDDIGRVREGYFEVILMGVSSQDVTVSTNTLEYNAKHVAGAPRDCAKVDELFLNMGSLAYMLPPENILKGHVTYINVGQGKAIDAEPTAIENFRTSGNIMFEPGDYRPDLSHGNFGASNLPYWLDDGAPTSTGSAPVTSVDTVTALLQADSLINEFATGGGNTSTSWVVTFPTKHHYTDNVGPFAPFSARFGTPTSGKSCDDIALTLYNREEGTVIETGSTQFSPAPVAGALPALCYEANVIDFNASSVFGVGTNRLAVNTSEVGAQGWAQLRFVESPAATTGLNGVFGLPAIGFAAIMRDGADATVNYGSSTAHTTVRRQAAP